MVKMYQYISDQVTGALTRLAQNSISIKNSRILATFIKKQNEEHASTRKSYENYMQKKEQNVEGAEQEWKDFLNTEIEVQKLPSDILDQIKEMSAADIILLDPLIEEKASNTGIK